MKVKQTKISEIKANPANPRVIKDDKFHKLVNSLLALPKMLELRPIVTDKQMIVLGGNQRLRALQFIADMDSQELEQRIRSISDVKKKKKPEIDALVQYWDAWQDTRTIACVKADELTEDEQRQFIIKDNSNFGDWDLEMLASQWDAKELDSWGIDTWKVAPVVMPEAPAGDTPQALDPVPENLPDELQGIDISPDELPKIEGDDQTAMERVIIVFQKEQAAELAAILGLEAIDKVLYRFDEIISQQPE